MSPQAPVYTVIFASRLRDEVDRAEYGAMAARMAERVELVPGFLGMHSARGADGMGVTVSYWRDERSARRWLDDPEHREAQRLGRERWYAWYSVRTGTFGVNQPYTMDPAAPFGGIKASGIGRELGREGLEGYVDLKAISGAPAP